MSRYKITRQQAIRDIIAVTIVAIAAVVIVALLAGCAGLKSSASSHPAARASASHAAQVIQHNKAAQADFAAADNCAVQATSSLRPSHTWKTCTEKAFPKGGVSNLLRCMVRVALTHIGQAKAKVEAAANAACGSIR